MYFDYSKRDYLLPPGCKDLFDVLKMHQPQPLFDVSKLHQQQPYFYQSKPSLWQQVQRRRRRPIPPITRYVTVSDPVSVKQLIELAGKKPFCIIAGLMDLGLFVNINGKVSFDIAARVLRWYGIAAVPAA
jgi:hypothetical protein